MALKTTYRSNGKLLVTGEYAVLDGAVSLALPTKYGQTLIVEPSTKKGINWIAYDHENQPWLTAFFTMEELLLKPEASVLKTTISEDRYLLAVLQTANSLNPDLLKEASGFDVTTHLEFPKNWGLGTSSTLINNLAQWFKVDPYLLLELTFGGSGYDIAAAQNDNPFTYERHEGKNNALNVHFDPLFKDELFFVHLGKKQNSRESIQHYRKQPKTKLAMDIKKISNLTSQFLACETLNEFELLIEIHETIISKLIDTPKVKLKLFPDFKGTVKSLGGWGGDFVLATGTEADMGYFRDKGYHSIIRYSEMVL